MNYDLELDHVVEQIKSKGAKKVCIQLPDGLKQKADMIKEELELKTDARIIIWLGSCFGACDIPDGLEKLGLDLLVQWGHNAELRMGQD